MLRNVLKQTKRSPQELPLVHAHAHYPFSASCLSTNFAFGNVASLQNSWCRTVGSGTPVGVGNQLGLS